MNGNNRDGDELNRFMDAYQRGAAAAPPSPEAELGAELMQLANGLEPDAAFVRQLASRLESAAKPFTPQPSDNNAFNGNGHSQEEHIMLAKQRLYAPAGRARWLPQAPLTLALALLLVMASGLLLLIRGFGTLPSLPNAAALQTGRLPITVGGWVSDFSEATLNQMRAAGIEWTASSLPFDLYNDNLDLAQAMITTAHQAGFKVMLRITGSPMDVMTNREGYNQAFATFLGQVAALKPEAIQVWNEPNSERYSPTPGEIKPISYTEMLGEAYQAIKAANPDVMVISAAPAPTSAETISSEQVVKDDVYYQGMANSGAAEFADCIGMNYLEGAVAPDQTSGDPRDSDPTRYLPTMLQRAFQPFKKVGKSVCVTQIGYLSDDGLAQALPDGYQWASKTTVDQQAEWLAGAVASAAASSDVPVSMILLWRINPVGDDALMNGFALIRPDGSCPACEMIGALRR